MLKSIIRNINRKNNDKKLRKYFNKWIKNIQDKNKTLDFVSKKLLKVIKINKGKYFFNKLKSNRKLKILKKIVFKHSILKRKDLIKHYFFRKWSYITKRLEQIENANIKFK